MPVSAIKYRPDIDGLRAIAVLSVVFYHYGIGPVHGGFVGVDVFFVISGYLITSIVHRQIGEGRFTFAGFYERRIRRIFPALFAVLAATLVAGVLILLPNDLRALSDATVATLLFASNILFWRRSGYFDPGSDLNPLLHTWSLAVEEQFYIVFPVFLIVVARFAPRYLRALLAVSAAVSLAACVLLQDWQPNAMFFLAPFRAWELALGGLLAVGAVPAVRRRALREGLALAALGLLLFSLWWTEAGLEFPGWQATLPVGATALLIHTGSSGDTAVHRLLGARPMVLVGLISYSLYLWHWPLIVYASYASPVALDAPGYKALLLLAAMALAAASYRWIETPFRHPSTRSGSSRRHLFAGALAATAVLAVCAFAARGNEALRSRFSDRVLALDAARQPAIPFQECDGQPPSADSDTCTIGRDRKGPVTLLWGDSHAMAWAPAFREGGTHIAPGPVVLALKSACPPLGGVTVNYGRGCDAFNEATLAWIARNRPARVVMMAAWTDYSRPRAFYELTDVSGERGNLRVFPVALTRTIGAVTPFAGEVVLIGPTPGAPEGVPLSAALAELHGRPWPKGVETAAALRKARYFWNAAKSLPPGQTTLIDPAKWFCLDVRCRYAAGENLLYRDEAHLSVEGARFAAKNLEDSLAEAP
jgi:peptidoglycan/LPS O-acetylase OafA/YrhL